MSTWDKTRDLVHSAKEKEVTADAPLKINEDIYWRKAKPLLGQEQRDRHR